METIAPMTGHNSAIAVYDEFRAQLAGLRELNEATVFDYEDSKGNKDARSHVYKLRQTKSAVEQTRKKEKAESLGYGRRVDEQAKEIASEIDKMIEVHAKPLEEIEQREKDRIARHKADIDEIEGGGQRAIEQWQELPLDAMKDRLAEIDAESIGEDRWEEFALIAAQTKEVAIGCLREAIAKREARDAEQAELARLRKEAEEREQAEREEQVRQEAAQMATAEAELKAAKVRDQAERRELELKLAAETAEREKAEAEQRAATAAKDAEERVRREAADRAVKEAAEADAREADKKHHAAVNRAAVAALVKGGLPEDMAKQAVTLIAQKAVPNVSISY